MLSIPTYEEELDEFESFSDSPIQEIDLIQKYANVLRDLKPKKEKSCCSCDWSMNTFYSFLNKTWSGFSLIFSTGASLSPVFFGIAFAERFSPTGLLWYFSICSLLVNIPINWKSLSQVPEMGIEISRFFRKLFWQPDIANEFKIDWKKVALVSGSLAAINVGTFAANLEMVANSTPNKGAWYYPLAIFQMLGLTAQSGRATINQTFPYFRLETNAAARLQKRILLEKLYQQYLQLPQQSVKLSSKDLDLLSDENFYRSNNFLTWANRLILATPGAMIFIYGLPFGAAAYTATVPELGRIMGVLLGVSAATSKILLLFKSLTNLGNDFVNLLGKYFFDTEIIPNTENCSLPLRSLLATLLFFSVVAHTGYGAAGITEKYLFKPLFGENTYVALVSLLVGALASLPINFRDSYQKIMESIDYGMFTCVTPIKNRFFGEETKTLSDEEIILKLMRNIANLSHKDSDAKYIQRKTSENFDKPYDEKLVEIMHVESTELFKHTEEFFSEKDWLSLYRNKDSLKEIKIEKPQLNSPKENTSLLQNKVEEITEVVEENNESHFSSLMQKIGIYASTTNKYEQQPIRATTSSKYFCGIQ